VNLVFYQILFRQLDLKLREDITRLCYTEAFGVQKTTEPILSPEIRKKKKKKKKTIDILEKSILRIGERQEEEQDINVERRERSTAKHPLVGITAAVTSF
jgi:hypothetical protein